MKSYLRLLRPRQFLKNIFCLAGVAFSGEFVHADKIVFALETFLCFCLVSSGVYVFNDIADRERDRLHPRKRERPIAAGVVGVPAALGLGLVVVLGGMAIAWHLNVGVLWCLVLYLGNSLAYTFVFKHLPLFDVLCIALGFLLRLFAGVYAVGDLPTAWISLCTFFLALFLGFSKRRAEVGTLSENDSHEQRPVLKGYNAQILDHLLISSAVMTIMCYALFTAMPTKNPSLVLTVPIVFFAVMYYLRLVVLQKAGEEAERVLLRNVPLQISIVLWLAAYFAITYGNLHWVR